MVLLAVLAMTATSVFAQKRSPIRFGLKAGINLSHMGLSDNQGYGHTNSFGPGFFAGGLMEISGPAGSKFKGQVEALFNFHNFKNTYTYQQSIATLKTRLQQISVPILVKYFVVPQLSLNLGGSVNFNLEGKEKIHEQDASASNEYSEEHKIRKDLDLLQTLQVGVLVGATYYIHKGFFVDARYNYYFGSYYKDKYGVYDLPSYRLSAVQIGLGYKF
ncbi:MAG: porin family protein [Edaphocola sp.]